MIRTLVVDDDFRVADIHRAYVEQVPGFQVVAVARTGTEAIDLAGRLRPDLVLLDIYLPDISGLDVLRRFRADRLAVDAMVITAAKDLPTLRAAVRGGSIHYLIKPFTFAVLRERLESYAAITSRLGGVAEASQADADAFHGAGLGHEELPKGLSSATRDVVLDVLRDRTAPVPASEVARLAGLSRVTARRYLDHLARVGLVELTLQYGSPGRPEHRYRIAVRG
ncbi:MAG: response regulator [Chloroflexota bacterium]